MLSQIKRRSHTNNTTSYFFAKKPVHNFSQLIIIHILHTTYLHKYQQHNVNIKVSKRLF